MGFNYSAEGIYSDEKLKTVSWLRHYGRFWLSSMGLCDSVWPTLVNYNDPNWDTTGATPDFEPRMYKAVTGLDLTFEESLEMGRKILMMDRAVWYLQGRTREMEQFADYVYEVPTKSSYPLTVYENGEWKFDGCIGRTLDREKFEDVKTRFYTLEGWDPQGGWPTRASLEAFDLGYVADELAANGVKVG